MVSRTKLRLCLEYRLIIGMKFHFRFKVMCQQLAIIDLSKPSFNDERKVIAFV